MKSERRHELQHNDLAEWILKGYQTVLPYKNSILGVSLLLVAVLIGVSLYTSHRASVEGAAWGSFGVPVFQPEFRSDQTLNMMQKTIAEYPRTTAAEWAKVFQGDTALMLGMNQILTDKKVGVENLTKAKEFYDEALQAPIVAPAKEQALFGRARAMESLVQNKSQLDDAIAAYKDLNENFPHGMFKAFADQRIEALSGSDALSFYTALAKYAPKPKSAAKPDAPQNPLKELGPLPENPPSEPAPKGSASGAGGGTGVPAPSMAPLEPGKTPAPKTETPKPEPSKPQPAAPEAKKQPPLAPDVPSPEPPKTEVPKKDK